MNKPIGTTDKLLGKVVGFAIENENKPIYESTKEIKVKIIDWKPLIEKIKASSPKLSNLNLQIRSGKGIIFVGKDKTPVLIDSECCGVDAEDKNLMINGELLCGMFIEGIEIGRAHV